MQQVRVEINPGRIPDEEFANFLECLKKDALGVFETEGELCPVAALFTDNSTDVIQWTDGGIPYDFIAQFYAGKTRAYVAAFESWYVKREKDDEVAPPSQCPDRLEALVVIGESRDGWHHMSAWDIIRNGGGVHLVRTELPEYTSSRMADVLWEETNAT